MRLFISDIEIPLPKNFKIARTKQVNDIGQLNNRQTNFTQRIKLPKTKETTQAFDYLGISGNTSSTPYTRNQTRLLNSYGESEIFNGYSVIKSTSRTYDITIYDGYVNFTKQIENKTLTDIDISELNHLKNLTNVVATWNDDTSPYRYILADYNGKTVYDDTIINVDYLIPSVNVKWLWDKVFEFYGWTYEGSVFDTENFNNLWLTYPKSIGDDSQQTISAGNLVWDDSFYYGNSIIVNFNGSILSNEYVQGSSEGTGGNNYNNGNITILQDGYYKLTISGTINLDNPPVDGSSVILGVGTLGSGAPFEREEIGSYEFGESFSFTYYRLFDAGESFYISGSDYDVFLFDAYGDVDTNISIVTGNQVDFEEAFIKFKISDFINEILWRFALTPFKDKYTNNIVFLTHQEWLQNDIVNDWSDKFVSATREDYILKGYAQRNYLRYKYNQREQSFNDDYLFINNTNIRDSKDIIKSKIYSPEEETTFILSTETKVYPFWTKENKDDGTVKYKDLKGRFYFMRSIPFEVPFVFDFEVGSELHQESVFASTFPTEDYSRLRFKDIVEDYYLPIYGILNKAKMLKAKVLLNDIDIQNLDFKKLIYFKQRASYYILNKIPNYIDSGVYDCEFIEVDLNNNFSEEILNLNPRILLSSVAVEPNSSTLNWSIVNQYTFLDYEPIDGVTIKAIQLDDAPDDGGAPTGIELDANIVEANNSQSFDMPVVLTADDCGWWQMEITDPNQVITSNITYVNIPCPVVVDPSPSIYVTVENTGIADSSIPLERDVDYTFYNFTPSSATLKLQMYDFFTNTPSGALNEITGLTLNQDTTNTEVDAQFLNGTGYYKIILETDTISFTIFSWIF